MTNKVFVLVGGAATFVAADPTIKIGLSGSGSGELRRVLDEAGQRQAGIANSGSLDQAYSAALSAAKAEIESVISAHMGGSSFLKQSVRVKVASTPGLQNDELRAVENYEAQGELGASRQMDTAAAEFSQLGNAVVNQLERALSEFFPKSSFLAAPGEAEGLGPVANVQITAGAFPTIANLVAQQGSVNVEGAIIDKMTSFVRDLNGIIAASLNSHSFLSTGRQANLKDVAAIAQAGVQESHEFLKASNQLPSASEQVAEVERLNAMDQSAAGASAGESDLTGGACLRDYSKPGAPCYADSFIQTGLNPAEIALKYLSARSEGESNKYSRPTQSPMVWMHYHHN